MFYSWGAGFAAIRQFRMNLGGAAQYNLDRYANFIGVMASCFTVNQRFALMKLSGGGIIHETPGLESLYGLSGSTATFGSIPQYWLGGATPGETAGSLIVPLRTRVPIEDNWMIPIKTPHTNYNNPRIRRRPLDTKLFSQPFCVDFWLSPFDEICDTGTGVCPLPYTDSDPTGNPIGPTFQVSYPNPKGNRYSIAEGGYFAWPDIGRQYEVYNGESVITAQFPADTFGISYVVGLNSGTFMSEVLIGGQELIPPDNAIPQIGPLLDAQSLPELSIESVIASLRLTNDMLGAYDVLKTRTDVCVYYPFQHLSTQIYSTPNTLYGGKSLDEYVKRTSTTTFPSDESYLNKIFTTVNIPVNPMTVMYIAVAREKDRKSLGISKPGRYSPCLFWNLLEMPQLEVTYGSQPILKYSCSADYLSEQNYEHVSALQIHYKGGFCLS